MTITPHPNDQTVALPATQEALDAACALGRMRGLLDEKPLNQKDFAAAMRAEQVLSNSVQNSFSIAIFYQGVNYDGEVAYNTTTLGGWTQIYERTGSNIWIHHNNISYSTNRLLEVTNVGVQIHGSSELSGIGMESGVSNIVEFNIISNVFQSVVDFYYESASEFRYNYSFHSGTAVVPFGCGLRVHHNIFYVDGTSGMGGSHGYDAGITTGPDTGNNLIYNNTFYALDGAGNYGLFSGLTSAGYDTNNINRNNIFVSLNTGLRFIFSQSTNINTDYNLYYCTAGTPTRWLWDNVDIGTFAAYKSTSGRDANSLLTDPLFASTSPDGAAGFRLLPGSPAARSGLNLKQAGLIVSDAEYLDYSGKPIPASGPVSMGAFEYGNTWNIGTLTTR